MPASGNIYTVDPVTNRSTVISRGPGDIDPHWSADGTRLVFERQDVTSGPGLLFVARADGSDPIQVTPQPLADITTYDFSPNGKEILISASSSETPAVFIAEADGSGIRQLDLPGRVTDAAWRPPDGSEVLAMDDGGDSNGTDNSIYAINVATGKVRTILKGADASTGPWRGHPAWSPDGSRISFGRMAGSEWPRRPNPHHQGGRDRGSHPSDPDRRFVAVAVYLVE